MMKKHAKLLCYLLSSYLRCVLVVFAFLFTSGPAEARPSVYPHLLCPCGIDAFNEAGSRSDHPGDRWNYAIHLLKHPPNAHQNASAGPMIPATSYATANVVAEEPGIEPGKSNRPSSHKARLLNLSIRGVLSSFDVIGDDAPEEFQAYDVAATFRLPWRWYSKSGWGGGVRLMTSAGTLTGDGDTGVVVSLLPLLALGRSEGTFTIDMGAGAALFSRSTFGTQDFGGAFQYALTAGFGIQLFKNLGAGYRFMHYSDAGLHGSHTTGADLHMLEITYRFQWTRSGG